MERETTAAQTWLPVILWTVIIALESAFGSAANTGPVLQKLATWLFGNVDPVRFEVSHGILRKAGHLFGYGILGYLWFRAFLRTFTRNTELICAALAIAFTFSIASLDEWHQSFSAARSGQFKDVLLDTFGALLLVSLAMIRVARPK